MTNLITYISVTRNNILGLHSTFDSLSRQTGSDFEWIVIDGASSDGSLNFLTKLRPTFNFKFISESDGGIFEAMNKGITLATGLYINFLNSGDKLDSPDTFAIVQKTINSNWPDLLFGDSFQQAGPEKSPIKRARRSTEISFGMFACHQSMYYKRRAVGELRYRTDLRCAGDYAFTAEFIAQNRDIVYIPEPLSVFDSTGFSSANEAIGRHENWLIQRDILKLGLATRLINQLRYLTAANLRKYASGVYRSLRFKQP